jgi:hypothetical protein
MAKSPIQFLFTSLVSFYFHQKYTKIEFRSLLSAIFVLGIPDPTLEKVASENVVRERCHVIIRVFVLGVRIASTRVVACGAHPYLPRLFCAVLLSLL